MLRDTPIDYIQKQKVRFHGRKMGGKKKVVLNPRSRTNTLSIAYRLYKSEISKKRWTAIAHLNPDDDSNSPSSIQGNIRNLIKDANLLMTNVSGGNFP